MLIDIEAVCKLLQEKDNFLILTHKSPDGDTIGSALSLTYALRDMGKRASVGCHDCPNMYDFIFDGYEPDKITDEYIVCVDIADTELLPDPYKKHAGSVGLCIDHHPSNRGYAENNLLVPGAAAAGEIIYDILKQLGVKLTKRILDCLFLSISTDTGCFRYSNTSPKTHRIAADLIESGADAYRINKRMFDTFPKERFIINRLAAETLEYHYGGLCAIMSITREMLDKAGIEDNCLDGLSSVPRQIAGVKIGILLKEERHGGFKVSVRSGKLLDASKLCMEFGGGGHERAAGCFIESNLDECKEKILKKIGEALHATVSK